MSAKSNPDIELLKRAPVRDASWDRQQLVRILFVQCAPANTRRCLRELNRMRFTVNAEVAATSGEVAGQLRSQLFDVLVAEYPSANWQETQLLELLGEMKKDVPLIFLVTGMKREAIAEFILHGAADCIETNSIGHLPVAVHKALAEKALRGQRDRAEKELRHSQARYRALAGNLSYGICRCSPDGRFMEVNEAMVRMFGYQSAEELLALSPMCEIIQDPVRQRQLLGQTGVDDFADPIETEWKRKDQTTLKVRLSGREVVSEQGDLEGYEVIAEDVTKQRELEDRLRPAIR